MEIKFSSLGKLFMFALIVINTISLTVIAVSLGVESWSGPLIALFALMLLGDVPAQSKDDVFMSLYVSLLIGSIILLLIEPKQAYWHAPLTMGVVIRVIIGEVKIKIG